MISSEELDILLVNAGMISVTQRLEYSPMDYFMATVEVTDLDTLYTWVCSTRRSYMEMHARHELEIHVLSEDVLDFVLGKQVMLAEFHINLRNVLHEMRKGK